MIRLAAALLPVVASTVAALAQQFGAGELPSPKSFAIMAWGDAPSDIIQLRGRRDAGLNIAGFCRTEDLDKIRDAGLACFVSDPRVGGYDWQALPANNQIRSRVSSLAQQIGSNPAAIGFFSGTSRTPRACPGWHAWRRSRARLCRTFGPTPTCSLSRESRTPGNRHL